MSIKIDQNYAYGRLSLVALFHKENEYDRVIRHGRELEKVDEVDANVLDKIGLAFWHKNNIPMSLYYFTKSASLETQAFTIQQPRPHLRTKRTRPDLRRI